MRVVGDRDGYVTNVITLLSVSAIAAVLGAAWYALGSTLHAVAMLSVAGTGPVGFLLMHATGRLGPGTWTAVVAIGALSGVMLAYYDA